jgi:hypothetical protein
MGAVQVLEPVMKEGQITEAQKPRYDHLVREAVSDIPREIMALGGTRAQGEAMAEAMGLMLAGEDVAKVRQALERGKYPHYALNDLIQRISKSLRPAV